MGVEEEEEGEEGPRAPRLKILQHIGYGHCSAWGHAGGGRARACEPGGAGLGVPTARLGRPPPLGRRPGRPASRSPSRGAEGT